MQHTNILKLVKKKSVINYRLIFYFINFYKLLINVFLNKKTNNADMFLFYNMIILTYSLKNLTKKKIFKNKPTLLPLTTNLIKDYNKNYTPRSNKTFTLFKTFLCFSENNFQFFFKPHHKYSLFFNCVTRDEVLSINLFSYFKK